MQSKARKILKRVGMSSALVLVLAVSTMQMSFDYPVPRQPLRGDQFDGFKGSVFIKSDDTTIKRDEISGHTLITMTGLADVDVLFHTGVISTLPPSIWFNDLGGQDPVIYSHFEIRDAAGTNSTLGNQIQSISYTCCGENSQLKVTISKFLDRLLTSEVELEFAVDATKTRCDFDNPKLDCPLGSLVGTNHHGLMIRDSSLIGANLSGIDLRDAVFLNVDFREAYFAGANLVGALFIGCELEGAFFDSNSIGGFEIINH